MEHILGKLHIIGWMICRDFLILIFFSALLTSSCAAASATPAPESRSPASLQPQEESAFVPAENPAYRRNIRFEHFSLEEGLSQSAVNVILQDRKGFLWVGTQDGLNRYDGYGFKVYRPDADNKNSLSDRWITALAEDNEGYLWVGTRLGGLNRYNPVTGDFKRFAQDSNEIGSNKITALLADSKGLWAGTDAGLGFFDYEKKLFRVYQSSAEDSTSLSGNVVTAIFKDTKGILWVGTSAGLNIFDEKTNSFAVYKSDEADITTISNNRILSIGESKDGRIWVGTASGLNRFDASNTIVKRYVNSPDSPYSLAGNSVYAIYQDRLGELWIGTNNGLDRFDLQTGRFAHNQHHPNIANSLNNNNVFAIYEDRNNVLWVGTRGGGLNKYNHQQDKFDYYYYNSDDPYSLSGNIITPISVDTKGYVWVGTEHNGLNKFDISTNQFTRYMNDLANPNSINSNDIISLYTDRKGVLWIGTARGLDRFNPITKVFQHIKQDVSDTSGPTNSQIYAIFEDSEHNLWIGTGHSLNLFNPDTQTYSSFETAQNNEAGVSGNEISAIFEDSKHILWIGTLDDGLKRINLEKNQIVQYKNDSRKVGALSNDTIFNIYQDSRGTLWICTGGGGLNRYNPETDTFTQYTEKEGLPNNVVYGILEDKDGILWLSTNFGISRFNPKDETFRNFTSRDGLQSNEFNRNAFAKDKNGRMYFGGINGLNVFLPKEITDNSTPPQAGLTALTEDGAALNEDRTVEYMQDLTLAWPQNSFEFEFSAFAFEQPGKNQYAYMLEGFDSTWNNIGFKRSGRYTNLPGGIYTLRLRAANSDGVWREGRQSVTITVVPPFWNNGWFRGIFLLALFAAIAGGLRWRVKNIERRNRELEYLVQNRTADLKKRNREMEALYQADEKILRNVSMNQVFQTLVNVSVSLLKADRSVVFTWNEAQKKIAPRVSHGFRPETLKALTYEEGEGMVGRAMKTGEPVIVTDLRLSDLRGDIQTVIRSEGIQSFAHFPIAVDGRVLALFNVGYTRPNALNEDSIRLFTALANRASLSITNMELFEQTKDLAVMEERNRLARDLHDSAKQKAFAALAQLGTANAMIKTKIGESAPHLSEAETLIYEVIQELNFLIQEIYPIALQEKGLQTTLREYIFEWENRTDIVSNLAVKNGRALPLDVEQAVYRFIQEALANVSRHSKASRADVSLVYNADSLQVKIVDNGQGFDINQRAKGMGLRSMRERIGSIHGAIQVQSAPGQGTCLTAQIPIKE